MFLFIQGPPKWPVVGIVSDFTLVKLSDGSMTERLKTSSP